MQADKYWWFQKHYCIKFLSPPTYTKNKIQAIKPKLTCQSKQQDGLNANLKICQKPHRPINQCDLKADQAITLCLSVSLCLCFSCCCLFLIAQRETHIHTCSHFNGREKLILLSTPPYQHSGQVKKTVAHTCKPGWCVKNMRKASTLLRTLTEARSAGKVGLSRSGKVSLVTSLPSSE